ncbi:MAG: hypothetical protein FRX49_02808 [Trebouxia sp. A1-2]|nr:MAG: hypothetical protein FRX49_02808 [Trebouxia sp. A1-2]
MTNSTHPMIRLAQGRTTPLPSSTSSVLNDAKNWGTYGFPVRALSTSSSCSARSLRFSLSMPFTTLMTTCWPGCRGPRYGGACNWARSAIDLTLALHMPSQQLGLMTWAVDDSFLGVGELLAEVLGVVKAEPAACLAAMVSPTENSSAGPFGTALALMSASGLSAAVLLSVKPLAACVLGSTFASLRAEELFGAAMSSALALGSASLMVAEG